MNKKFFKNLMLVVPVIITVAMLFLVNYSTQYFKDVAYHFVYKTNIGSVNRFYKELNLLTSEGYTKHEYSELYTDIIMIYNKTLGEKDAIITFLVDQDGVIYHSSDYNQKFLTPVLENYNITGDINLAINGEVRLNGWDDEVYFHRVSDGEKVYYLFMGIEREKIESELHANQINFPIGIMGLLILVITEYAIWLKLYCNPCISGEGD